MVGYCECIMNPRVSGEFFDVPRTVSCVVQRIKDYYNYCHGLPC